VVVISAAERDRQERRAAWAVYAPVRAELAALRAEAAAYRSLYGAAVSAVPAGKRVRPKSSPAALRAATAEARQLIETHRRRLADDVATAARAQAIQLLADARAAQAALSMSTLERPSSATVDRPVRMSTVDSTAADEEVDESWRGPVEARATALLARLPAGAPGPVRAACERAVAEMVSASERRSRMLLGDLERRVDRVKGEEERAAAARRDLSALAARLESVVDGATDAHRELAGAIERTLAEAAPQVPVGLAERVEAVVDAADRAHRRKVIATAWSTSLREMQYTVSEGFETVLASEGVAYTNLPERPGYGVKHLLDRSDDTVRTQVVRTADNTETDADAERSFCAGFPDLLRRLRRNGVEPTQVATTDPGTVPVRKVADALVPAAAAEDEYRAQHSGSQHTGYQEREQER
jgi:hypothetical protein